MTSSPTHFMMHKINVNIMEGSTLLSIFLTFLCVFVPTLLLILYRCSSKKKLGKRTYLLFIDAPDPDNPASALSLWNHLLHCLPSRSSHLHVILTGRPVNLRTKKEFRKDTPIRDQIPRQPWESTELSHSRKLLMDSAKRISNYLILCGVSSSFFTIYDGGIASCAPISDVAHDWEFLYDRKDLVTSTPSDEGSIITGEEYKNFVHEYNSQTEDERESTFLGLLREYKLTPLSQLRVLLRQSRHKEICVFLGGPATAVVELFQGAQNTSLRDKVSELYAMFGALSPDKSTLLGNQFNAACDMESAAQLFLENMFPNTPMYVVPTETAKLPELIVSAEELERRGACPYAVSLIKLWEATHGGKPQPIFDVLPVMAALPQFRAGFTWEKKRVVIQEWSEGGRVKQQFIFAESGKGSLYVSDGTFNSSRECFMQFLDLCFKS